MNLLQLLRTEGEKLVEAEIPAVSELARVVAALVKYEEGKLKEAEQPPASIYTPVASTPAPVAPVAPAPVAQPTNADVLSAVEALNARLGPLPAA